MAIDVSKMRDFVYGPPEGVGDAPGDIVESLKQALEAAGIKFSAAAGQEDILQAAVDVIEDVDPKERQPNRQTARATSMTMFLNSLPPGRERELVAQGLREHGGNLKLALCGLQRRLLEPLLADGFTQQAATKMLKPAFPHIF